MKFDSIYTTSRTSQSEVCPAPKVLGRQGYSSGYTSGYTSGYGWLNYMKKKKLEIV